MSARHTVSIQTLPVHIFVKKFSMSLVLKRTHFEALEQTCRLRPLEGSVDNYYLYQLFIYQVYSNFKIPPRRRDLTRNCSTQ